MWLRVLDYSLRFERSISNYEKLREEEKGMRPSERDQMESMLGILREYQARVRGIL